MCFKAPSIPAPPPVPELTPEQKDLQTQQLELTKENLGIIRQGRAEEEAGRKAFETLTGTPYAEWIAKQAKTQADISGQIGERYQKALKGELPVSPTLERSIAEEEQNLRATLQRRLGPGWETSTTGQQALQDFRKRGTELREQAQRGEITTAEQLGFSAPGGYLQTAALYQPKQMQMPQGLESLYNQYNMDRSLQSRRGELGYQGSIAQAQLRGQRDQGLMGLLGQGVGSAAALAMLKI